MAPKEEVAAIGLGRPPTIPRVRKVRAPRIRWQEKVRMFLEPQGWEVMDLCFGVGAVKGDYSIAFDVDLKQVRVYYRRNPVGARYLGKNIYMLIDWALEVCNA